LGLLPGCLTPTLQEHLVRLGTWVPFRPAAQLLTDFMGLMGISEPTARRHTQAAGAVQVAEQTRTVEDYEHHPPPVSPGPDKLLLSADGAMVPLVDGTWAEVKTLVLGEVAEPEMVAGEAVVHTTALSYFSRLTDNQTFERLALIETQRRGVESARAVVAVTDGAEWLQGFIAYHCPEAVRVLDFPHAAEYISTIGALTLGDGHSPPPDWLATQLHHLKHTGPQPVFAELRTLAHAHPTASDVADALAYLEKREALMQYPDFQAAGWPLGSGSVESANKLVVEARLKGSGMHWQRTSVNPMLALRNVVCNDRWAEAWPTIATAWRQSVAQCQRARHDRHRAAQREVTALATVPPTSPVSEAIATLMHPTQTPPPKESNPPMAPRRPAANHPWRAPIGKARYQPKISRP